MADPETPDPRTRLREVALGLFGRQGVRETSTRQILAAAGMRNPSAISYYFGSKAELVEDLAGELLVVSPVLVRQIELAAGPSWPTVEAWTAIAVDLAVNLGVHRARVPARSAVVGVRRVRPSNLRGGVHRQ